jgi:hypothetical protein
MVTPSCFKKAWRGKSNLGFLAPYHLPKEGRGRGMFCKAASQDFRRVFSLMITKFTYSLQMLINAG